MRARHKALQTARGRIFEVNMRFELENAAAWFVANGARETLRNKTMRDKNDAS